MSLTPKTFSEYKASKLYCRDPEQYERCMDDCHETTWDASRAALMAELLKGGGCSTVDELTSRLQALIDCLPSAPYREKLAEAVAEALVMIDHSRASEAVLRKALEQERETSHQLREARHRDMVEDGAELASLRKRLAEVEGELDGLRTKIRERRDEMPEQCWCDKSDGCDCPAHDVFVELGALLDPDKYPYQPTTASQLRTHFGIPEGEDVVEGVKARFAAMEEWNRKAGTSLDSAIREAESMVKAANGLSSDLTTYGEAIEELRAYHNLPSDLSPMDVVKRSVGAFQEVQARAERGPPCGECEGEGGDSETCCGKGYGDVTTYSWTCETCGGSGSELDALKREVQALKADIQNREVNARESVTRTQGSRAIQAIAAERQRQVEQEGWGHTHDDQHSQGDLAAAASCYALSAAAYGLDQSCQIPLRVPDIWPWHADWWKPKSKRRDLERAGALIVAELERLDRAEDPTPTEQVSWERGPGKVDRESLANFIRSIDGRHEMGAGEMAESIAEWMEGRR